MADKDNIAYAFPDDGACKRFHHFFGDDNPITCVKIRDGNKRIVKVKDGNYEKRTLHDYFNIAPVKNLKD